MPWKLIFFLAAAAVVLVFVAVNVGATASVSFVFFRTPETPVFLIILVSFLLGMLSLLPMVIIYRPRKARGGRTGAKAGMPAGSGPEGASTTAGEAGKDEEGGSVRAAPAPADREAGESRRGKKGRS